MKKKNVLWFADKLTRLLWKVTMCGLYFFHHFAPFRKKKKEVKLFSKRDDLCRWHFADIILVKILSHWISIRFCFLPMADRYPKLVHETINPFSLNIYIYWTLNARLSRTKISVSAERGQSKQIDSFQCNGARFFRLVHHFIILIFDLIWFNFCFCSIFHLEWIWMPFLCTDASSCGNCIESF